MSVYSWTVSGVYSDISTTGATTLSAATPYAAGGLYRQGVPETNAKFAFYDVGNAQASIVVRL